MQNCRKPVRGLIRSYREGGRETWERKRQRGTGGQKERQGQGDSERDRDREAVCCSEIEI